MPQGSSGEWASGDGMDVAAVESDVLTRVRPLLVDDQRCPEVKFLRATRQRRLPSAILWPQIRVRTTSVSRHVGDGPVHVRLVPGADLSECSKKQVHPINRAFNVQV